jgi:putative PEP-CTERM system TPR-repeat lipoprotein
MAIRSSGTPGTAGLAVRARTLMRWACVAALLAGTAGCDYFTSVGQRVERAQGYLAQGDTGRAALELKKALARKPDDAPALLTYARVLYKGGDLDGAQRQLDLAVRAGAPRADTLDVQASIWLFHRRFDDLLAALKDDHELPAARHAELSAQAQLGSNQLDAAAATLAAGLQAAPADARLQLRQAQLFVAQGHLDQALEACAGALRADPRLAEAWMLRGQLLARQGGYGAAIEALSKAREIGLAQLDVRQYGVLLEALGNIQLTNRDAKGVDATIVEIEKRFPGAPTGHFLRGRLALLNGDFPRAVNELQQVVDAAPGFAPGHLMLGAALLYARDLKRAQSELSGLVNRDPGNVDAHKLLAQVDIALRRPDDARRVLAEVPQGSADSQVEWLMGMALIEGGRGEAGLDFLEQSVATEKPGDDRRLKLAQAYIVSGHNDKAIALLEGLEPAARTPDSQGLLVVATVRGRDPKAALPALAALVARHPVDDAVLAAAGRYADAQGNLALADQYLGRSLAANPKNVPALMELSRLRFRQGRLDDAEASLKSIEQIEPKNEVAYLGLASLAARRGDNGAVQKLLEQAIAADPSVVRARLALAQLSLAGGDAARAQSLIEQAVGLAKDKGPALTAAGEILLRGGLPDPALARFTDAVAAGVKAAAMGQARAQIALGRYEEARRSLASLADNADLRQRADLILFELDLRQRELDGARRRVARLRTEGLPPAAADELEGTVDMMANRFADADRRFTAAIAQLPSPQLAVKAFQARAAAGVAHPDAVLRQWLEKHPGDAFVRVNLAGYEERSGARADAIAQYERVLHETAQPDPLVLNNLAWLYIQAKDPRAVDTARRAFAIAPANPQVADTYGWALLGADKAAEGIEPLSKAAELAPKDPSIHYHLASAYAATGDRKRAADLLAPLLKSTDAFPERADAEALQKRIQ